MPPDVDISSYRMPEGPSPLDTANKLGSMVKQQQDIERGGYNVEKEKLDLMNTRFQLLNKELTTVVNDPEVRNGGPNAANKIIQAGQNWVKLGLIPPQMWGEFVKSIPTDGKQIPAFLQQTIARAQGINDAVNDAYGVPGVRDTGQQQVPIATSRLHGVRTTGPGVQNQLPPGTPVVEGGQPKLLGPQPPVVAPGAVAQPPTRFPVTPPDVTTTGPYNQQPLPKSQDRVINPNAPLQPKPVKTESYKAVGPNTASEPMFEQGKADLQKDQQVAQEKLFAIKPALQAFPLLEGLRSGPTTEAWTKVVATLKANNLIPIEENDPTAIRQIVNKKLAQYVSQSGTRSDADQALKEASSPNAGTQISPALIKLTRDQIVLDRVRAAVPSAFEGDDYSKYGQHRATFPNTIDERAFGLDLLKDEKERKALIDDMKKKKDTAEGKKFWKSLAIADKLGLY